MRRAGDDAWESISVRAESASPAQVVGSRSHRGGGLAHFLAAAGETEMVPIGRSLKVCVVADGSADVYPRHGPTSEWDTAAAQAGVDQAGGQGLKTAGDALDHTRPDDILNPWVIVVGPKDHDWLAMVPDAG